MTRARAFEWLGIPNIIPIRHSAHWLHDDLTHTIRALAPGESVVVDYEGKVQDAPSFTIEHQPDGEFTAVSGEQRWSWRGTVGSSIDHAVFDLLTHLRDVRGARGVILVPPRD